MGGNDAELDNRDRSAGICRFVRLYGRRRRRARAGHRADPGTAASLLSPSGLIEKTDTPQPGVLSVTLRVGSTRDTVAELNRRLVEGGIAVYGLHEVQTSLEDWFLSVTSRLGEPEL